MKCIALLSGGKDSVAAVEIAQGHGWEVVAGLRMVPSHDDSYMFHTPNLTAVGDVAACLGIPLITASSSNDPDQEVVELEQALARTKDHFGADAIISGALASDYQRTRIDRIGHRIGLHSFAPLWHVEPVGYMRSLVASGYDIRFSRVAADGLANELAGQRIDATCLRFLESQRLHVAGEGGEYETIVLDAPHYKSRIEVLSAHVEASASRATWHIDETRLVPKVAQVPSSSGA
jgi:diphthine-ammonia ligase